MADTKLLSSHTILARCSLFPLLLTADRIWLRLGRSGTSGALEVNIMHVVCYFLK